MNILNFLLLFASLLVSTLSYGGSQDFTSLPLKLVDGLPMIEVAIEGQKFPLLLDLGATQAQLVLSPKTLAKLHIHAPKLLDKTFENACKDKLNYTHFPLAEVSLGGFNFSHVEGFGYSQSPACSTGKETTTALANGLVGLSFFRGVKLILDYPRNRVVLFRNEIPEPYKAVTWQILDLTKPWDKGLITLGYLGSKPLRVIWDTGSNYSVLKASFFPELSVQSTVKLEKLSLGKYPVKATEFYLLNKPLPFDATLGLNFYQDHLVLIDFKHHKLGMADIHA